MYVSETKPMILPLTRPLIAIDTETHDLCQPEQARIVELGFKIVYPSQDKPCEACLGKGQDDISFLTRNRCVFCGGTGKHTPEPKRWVSFIRPDLTISEGATKVHGITNEVVFGCKTCHERGEPMSEKEHDKLFVEHDHEFHPWPTFNREFAENLAKGFTNVNFCGHNVRFDLRCIAASMERAGVPWSQGDARLLDSMHLWRVGQPRTLTDAVKEFLQREPSKAHRALEDAEDALDVALAQLERWPNLPRDLGKLHDLCYDPTNVDPDGKLKYVNGEAVFTFGKYKDIPLRRADKKYLEWMLTGDFSSDVRQIVREALTGKYPTKTTTDEPAPF